MTLYIESTANQTDHFVDAFISKNVAYGYDAVQTFERIQPMPF